MLFASYKLWEIRIFNWSCVDIRDFNKGEWWLKLNKCLHVYIEIWNTANHSQLAEQDNQFNNVIKVAPKWCCKKKKKHLSCCCDITYLNYCDFMGFCSLVGVDGVLSLLWIRPTVIKGTRKVMHIEEGSWHVLQNVSVALWKDAVAYSSVKTCVNW